MMPESKAKQRIGEGGRREGGLENEQIELIMNALTPSQYRLFLKCSVIVF